MWSRRGTLLSDSSPTPFISLSSEQSTRTASATPVRSPSLSGRRVSYIRWKKKKILFWCNVFHYIIHSSVLVSVSMRQYILDTGCRAEAEIMRYMLWKNKTCFACAVSKLIAFSVWCSSAGSNVEFHQKVVLIFCYSAVLFSRCQAGLIRFLCCLRWESDWTGSGPQTGAERAGRGVCLPAEADGSVSYERQDFMECEINTDGFQSQLVMCGGQANLQTLASETLLSIIWRQ